MSVRRAGAAPFTSSRWLEIDRELTEQKHAEAEESGPLTIKEFGQGIREGRIEGYVCKQCGHKQIDIIDFCPVCHGSDLQRTEFAKEGKVLTYTIQLVAPEQFMNEVPYAWAIIQLNDGPNVTGWIPFISKPSDLPVGQRVRFKKSYLPGIVFEKI
jgi:scaffold protein (connect acetoacetyl-CoA thiolase and HMG-CoA synthase)